MDGLFQQQALKGETDGIRRCVTLASPAAPIGGVERRQQSFADMSGPNRIVAIMHTYRHQEEIPLLASLLYPTVGFSAYPGFSARW